MKLKMIVAEDEQSFREGLIALVDWKLYDIEVTGVAENGRQALEMIMNNPPDLLLTDIRMPYMNGLEVIRKAKADGVTFHTILLTGYNEFEYAKEAINLGVSDYLLKPCVPQDIIRVILDVKRKIEASAPNRPLLSEMNRAWNRNIHHLKNQILTQWIQKPLMPLEDRSLVIREVDLTLQPGPIEIGLIRMDTHKSHYPYSERDLELIRFAILNITNESLTSAYDGRLEVFRHGDDILWFGNYPTTASEHHPEAMMKQLKINLESHLKLTISLSVSSMQPSVNDAHLAYQQALKAMEERFYQGNGGIFFHTEMNRQTRPRTSIMDDAYLQQWEKEWFVYLQNEQYGQVVDSIAAGLDYFKEHPEYSRAEIILRVTSLILELQKFAKERYPGSIEWQDGVINWIEKMPDMETIDECSSILQKIVQCIVEAASNHKVLHRTVHATIELIRNKYSTNLTLELAAKETFVSSSYLSSLFKQELGVNFLDYLHQFRVERAKDLLLERYKIYAVAKLVGYQEERHFSSTFKKWTGLTPRQYQKSHIHV
ncbi:response regulator [Cohnella sp. WQ 127256]|uniref:response regulator transcription factor n=1 Tax=Cohnella sp. WQ 127256 TaxID=2938790 RepID=UPI0021181BE5|nr:response regulator [Cohnella sp. WQ 127256]